MANSFAGGSTVTTAIANNFIPELWSDEVIGSYKQNLVLANLVTKMSHKGKKGDTVYIPVPSRDSAAAKAANTQVTLQDNTNSKVTITINKHYEYSKLIEDIAEVQSLASMRKFYTDDAGYALAQQVDDDLFGLTTALNGGTVLTGAGTTWASGAAADITDAGIRKMILTLDNSDVPMDNRSLVIPPIAANDLLAINRFTEQQFIGNGDAIKTGKIGQIYGIDVYVTSNCPSADTNANRVGVMLHRDALCLIEQMGVRTQTQYKQEYLGDLFTADTIYGVGELRDYAGVAFKVAAS